MHALALGGTRRPGEAGGKAILRPGRARDVTIVVRGGAGGKPILRPGGARDVAIVCLRWGWGQTNPKARGS
eukprot:1156793-Pelagomonas_calceolata.AAC.5